MGNRKRNNVGNDITMQWAERKGSKEVGCVVAVVKVIRPDEAR